MEDTPQENQPATEDNAKAYVAEILDRMDQRFEHLKQNKANVLIAGQAGVGKGSLINAIFGEYVAEVGSGRPITQTFDAYEDHPYLNLYDSKGWEGGEENAQEFHTQNELFLSKHRTGNPRDHIHIVWYLISAPGDRVQEYDMQLVKQTFRNLPVIFVITKCDIARPQQIHAVREEIKRYRIDEMVGIVEVAADPLPQISDKALGLEELVELTLIHLPELQKKAFSIAQQISLDAKAEVARWWILSVAAGTAGIGMIPLPFSDALVLTPVQGLIIARVAHIYGIDKSTQNAVAAASFAPFAAQIAGQSIASSVLTLVPVLGWATKGAIAGGFTLLIGFTLHRILHQIRLYELEGKEHPITQAWVGETIKEFFPMVRDLLKSKKNPTEIDYWKWELE